MQINIICLLILIKNIVHYSLLFAYIYVFRTQTKQIDFVIEKLGPKYMQKSYFFGKNSNFWKMNFCFFPVKIRSKNFKNFEISLFQCIYVSNYFSQTFLKKLYFLKLNRSKDFMNLHISNDLIPIYCKKLILNVFLLMILFHTYSL
jgi:hypothetical protein